MVIIHQTPFSMMVFHHQHLYLWVSLFETLILGTFDAFLALCT